MVNNEVCAVTHGQLLVGLCPWCNSPISSGELIQDSPSTVNATPQWNLPAMMESLEHEDASIRLATVFNTMAHCTQQEISFYVLQTAMRNSDVSVRDFAVAALCDLGSKTTSAVAEDYEARVKSNSADLAVRVVLLSYYLLRARVSNSARKARNEHVLWIITHAPESTIAGRPEIGLDADGDIATHELARRLWFDQVQTYCENAAILGNAAAFFIQHDRQLSETLLRKAQSLEPDDPQWSKRLAHLYSLGIDSLSSDSRQHEAARSLVEYEKAFEKTLDKRGRFNLLTGLARTALEAGQLDKARTYATELLGKATLPEAAPYAGDELHQGNLVLGRLALKSGDIEQAKIHLLEAASVPTSPALGSFGPNMALAKELLEVGERETVIRYLELCARFWHTPNQQCEQWIRAIKRGEMPDFGANLVY